MSYSLIVAMSQNGIIGNNNQLPWHCPEDLKHFKNTTMGHPIVMGRKTFESIGKPLPGRENIVLTRNSDFKHSDLTVINRPEILDERAQNEEIFITGGADIFKLFYPKIKTLHITIIHQDATGDIAFPFPDWQNDFVIKEKSEIFHSQKNNLPYQFIRATR